MFMSENPMKFLADASKKGQFNKLFCLKKKTVSKDKVVHSRTFCS